MSERIWCVECGDAYLHGEGCRHGRDLCLLCVHACLECVAEIKDEMAGEGV